MMLMTRTYRDLIGGFSQAIVYLRFSTAPELDIYNGIMESIPGSELRYSSRSSDAYVTWGLESTYRYYLVKSSNVSRD